MTNDFLKILAIAYGEGVYGADVYQSTNTQETTTETAQPVNDVSAPSTGFINSGPEVLAPVILGASIVVAVVVVAIKKRVRKSRNQ